MAAHEIEYLAKEVAKEVEALVTDMLKNGRKGEIIIPLGFNEITIYEQPKHLVWRRKLDTGHWSSVQRVKA